MGLTENALPLLHEIRHALIKFVETSEPTTLDLQAIPFGPGDEEKLLSFLGVGEVSAALNALGESRVFETGYPGVWVVEHRNTEQGRVALQIEVTDVPAILRTQSADLHDSIALIGDTLQTE
ncbi:MAG: hydrogenase expression/formation protein [Chromatiales bacterium]|nr:hydrogenase expression/formation protein [Chromatiales bacterium]